VTSLDALERARLDVRPRPEVHQLSARLGRLAFRVLELLPEGPGPLALLLAREHRRAGDGLVALPAEGAQLLAEPGHLGRGHRVAVKEGEALLGLACARGPLGERVGQRGQLLVMLLVAPELARLDIRQARLRRRHGSLELLRLRAGRLEAVLELRFARLVLR